MKKTSAFTLIELLVVVAIIAILAALLFPNITAMMQRGRAIECANNLRTVGSDMRHYLNEHSGTFVSLTDPTPWPESLQTYTKEWKHFRSPFDRQSAARPKNFDTPPLPISYGLNEKLFDTISAKWNVSESNLILAAPALDLGSSGGEVKFQASAFSDQNVKIVAPGGNGTPQDRGLGTHLNRQKINVLFCDGRVEELAWEKYADSTTPAGKSHWEPN